MSNHPHSRSADVRLLTLAGTLGAALGLVLLWALAHLAGS